MWFLCQRIGVRPREEWTSTHEEHIAWMQSQHEAGAIVMSGPTASRDLSMYLIRAGSREEAERIAAADPHTAAGGCRYELIEWRINEIMGAGFRR